MISLKGIPIKTMKKHSTYLRFGSPEYHEYWY